MAILQVALLLEDSNPVLFWDEPFLIIEEQSSAR
jgi:hypothetical protein